MQEVTAMERRERGCGWEWERQEERRTSEGWGQCRSSSSEIPGMRVSSYLSLVPVPQAQGSPSHLGRDIPLSTKDTDNTDCMWHYHFFESNTHISRVWVPFWEIYVLLVEVLTFMPVSWMYTVTEHNLNRQLLFPSMRTLIENYIYIYIFFSFCDSSHFFLNLVINQRW